jgi:bifunctional UDP-N-acetylglucosamine pyrophosphorylase/glucosamine-1-phosphate N-acetyltransferase
MVLNVVVMAAGQGTRMRSKRPKVLHTLAGRGLLQHVLGAVAGLGATRTVIVTGHGAAEVERSARVPALAFVRQEPQLAPAMRCGRPHRSSTTTERPWC